MTLQKNYRKKKEQNVRRAEATIKTDFMFRSRELPHGPQPSSNKRWRQLCWSCLQLHSLETSVILLPSAFLMRSPHRFFSLQKTSGVVKAQEKKERWKEKKVAKRQKKEDQEVEEEEENVQPVVDPLENGFLHHAEREQERMNERLLKKTYSKKNKMVSVSASLFLCWMVPFFAPVTEQLSLSYSSPWENSCKEIFLCPCDSWGPIILKEKSLLNISLRTCQTWLLFLHQRALCGSAVVIASVLFVRAPLHQIAPFGSG